MCISLSVCGASVSHANFILAFERSSRSRPLARQVRDMHATRAGHVRCVCRLHVVHCLPLLLFSPAALSVCGFYMFYTISCACGMSAVFYFVSSLFSGSVSCFHPIMLPCFFCWCHRVWGELGCNARQLRDSCATAARQVRDRCVTGFWILVVCFWFLDSGSGCATAARQVRDRCVTGFWILVA